MINPKFFAAGAGICLIGALVTTLVTFFSSCPDKTGYILSIHQATLGAACYIIYLIHDTIQK